MNHSFNVEIAKDYGIEEAILLENIYFWCEKNRANRKLINGKPWTYNSVKAFNELFCYMSPSKITRALANLEKNGLIETGNFNKNPYDRTKWYCITEKAKQIFQSENYILHEKKSICQNEKCILQNEQMNITDINTDINTDCCSTNNDNDNFLESNPKSKKETPSKKFLKPSVEEIADYCKERGNSIDAQYFYDYYESKGWLIGKNHMKDWKACVRTWERKEDVRKKAERKESAYGDFENVFEARAYSEEMIAKDNSLYDFFDKHYNDWLLAHCPTGKAFEIFRQKQISIDEKNGRSYDYWSND